MLDEWEQRRQDDLARDIFGDDGEWATMMTIMMTITMMISRIVLMRSALKHLIVAGIEIHCLTSLYILCGKDSASIRNSLQLAI